MARRNVTIQLDEEVLRRARRLAAERDTSISRLVAEQLEVMTRHDARYQAARREASASMRASRASSGGHAWTRGELHERS
ncbi:MAG: hypothetical protein FJW88_02365 [Actinobacteria bacterium]|nr:hypothetical protein [Actinomycetota bacterium]